MRIPSGPRLLRHVQHQLRPRRKKRPGTPPGVLVYEGEAPSAPASISLIDYDASRISECEVTDVSTCAAYRDPSTVTWINVEGIHEVDKVEELGGMFGMHPLTLEDVVSPRQRPKLEEYDTYIYVALQMMHYDHDSGTVQPEQVSIVFGDGFLISFQEGRVGDAFDPVRRRLRESRGHVRSLRADYLAYALIDVVVDYYLEILEGLGEHVEALEDLVTTRTDTSLLRDINALRRSMLVLRRAVWPLRDVIVALERTNHPFVSDAIDPYLRDVYDHTVRTVELIESSREILASLVDVHLSTVNNSMNEVMRVLTIIATFFLPLTFIVGIYGMNFNPAASPLNMPELNWFFGYPFAWALMLGTAGVMYFYFRRKGWL